MKTRQILKELEKYLSPYDITYLWLCATPNDLGLCLAISEICERYRHFDRETERVVSKLLALLCKNTFKKLKK